MNTFRSLVLSCFALACCYMTTMAQSQQQDRPIGINLSFITDWSPQFVFKDAMKQARPWYIQRAWDWSSWAEDTVTIPTLDNGYPTHVPFYQGADSFWVHTLLMNSQWEGYPSGEYTLIFEGKGQIYLDGDVSDTIFTEPDMEHTVTVNPTTWGVHLTILESDIDTPIQNIRFLRPGLDEDYDTEPFHPTFLEMLEPYSVIRMVISQEVLWSWISDWDDRATTDYYTQASTDNGGMAVEYQAAICNEANADLWVNIPAAADSNFIVQYATALYNNLDTNLKVYLEYGNENWNYEYVSYEHCRNMGIALELDEDTTVAGLEYSVYRSLEIFEIFEDVFGGEERLVKVIATQTAWPWVGQIMLQAYTDSTINPNNVTADAFAIAPYFAMGYPYDSATGDDYNNIDYIVENGLLSVLDEEDVLDSVEKYLPIEVPNWISTNQALADSFGLDLISYESGQDLRSVRYHYNDTVVDLMTAANRNERMRDIYCDYFDTWYGDTDSALLMTFDLVSSYTEWGNFGLYEHMEQDTSTTYKLLGHYDCVFSHNGSSSKRGAAPKVVSLMRDRLKVFPNPSKGQFLIELPTNETTLDRQLSIYNLQGQAVWQKTIPAEGSSRRHWPDLEALPSGLYVVQLQTGEALESIKLVKE